MILLQGGEQHQRYCTDVDTVFRQVTSFTSYLLKHLYSEILQFSLLNIVKGIQYLDHVCDMQHWLFS